MSAPFTLADQTPGQTAYEAWNLELNSGLEDEWEELSGSYEAAWECIARAVLNNHSLAEWALQTAVGLARKDERARVLEDIRSGKIDLASLMSGADDSWGDDQ